MSKKQITISDQVMGKIRLNKIRIRPRIFYVLGSLSVFISLVISIISTIFLVSVTQFSIKTHGPMRQVRFEQLLSSFPWWAPVFAIIGMIIGIKLIQKYDFSYKINIKILILGFIFAVVVAGLGIDALGLDEIWFRTGRGFGQMRKFAP